MKTIKVVTTFSGYDSQCLALRKLGVPFDLVAWSDVDAIKAHDCIFPEYKDRNLGDMRQINWVKVKEENDEIDLLTYTSPCTDISTAGYQMGLEKGSGTRSSLLWEVEKCIETLKPKYLLLENVKALASARYSKDFQCWLDILDKLGYDNYSKILDASDYGIPQHRERLFVVSVRKDLGFRYEFPEPLELTKTLNDLLVDDAEEFTYIPEMYYRWYVNGETPDVSTFNVKQNVIKKLFDTGKIDITKSGQWIDVYNKSARNDDICGTITTRVYECNQQYVTQFVNGKYIIRHIVPRECFRLMGVEDYYFDRLSDIKFKTLFVLGGNSIVVDCLVEVFRKLFLVII